jgi:hypothetical protein
MAETIMRWMTMITVCIGQSMAKGAETPDAGHMGVRARLYTIPCGNSTLRGDPLQSRRLLESAHT